MGTGSALRYRGCWLMIPIFKTIPVAGQSWCFLEGKLKRGGHAGQPFPHLICGCWQRAPGTGDTVLEAPLSLTLGPGVQIPAGGVMWGQHPTAKRVWGGLDPSTTPPPRVMFPTAGRNLGCKIPLQPQQGSWGGSDPALSVAPRRVKAKKGVNLLSTKSRSVQWLVSSELLTGGKHSTATVDVARAEGAGPR